MSHHLDHRPGVFPTWRPMIRWSVAIAIIAIATVALAVWLSREDTAPDTFSAVALGTVDIGDAAIEGIFTDDMTGMAPGESHVACVRVTVDAADATDPGIVRLHVPDANGALADDLAMRVETGTLPAGPAGHVDCSQFTTPDPIANSTLAVFGSIFPDYQNGSELGTVAAGTTWQAGLRFTASLPADLDVSAGGETASMVVAIENRATS